MNKQKVDKEITLDEFRKKHEDYYLEDIEEGIWIYNNEIIPEIVDSLEFTKKDFDLLKRKNDEVNILYELKKLKLDEEI